MKIKTFIRYGLVALLCATSISHARAASSSSTNYSIIADSLDIGGAQVSSANYSCQESLGGMTGLSAVASPVETMKAGYVGQIDFVTGLQLETTFIANGATQDLNATQTLDDGSIQSLGGPGASWTVSSGQLPAGLMLDSSTGIISGTPTGVGTYSFTIRVSDGIGDSATEAFSGIVTQNFAQWEHFYNITDSPSSIPLNDGVPTLFKYLYNINPSVPISAADRAALPVVEITTPTGDPTTYLTLTYRQYAAETGLTIQVQSSSDLQTWTTPINSSISQIGTASTGDFIMKAQIPFSGTREFIRLNVTSP